MNCLGLDLDLLIVNEGTALLIGALSKFEDDLSPDICIISICYKLKVVFPTSQIYSLL